jgi:hypothetical protein
MSVDPYAWHRSALAGNKPPLHTTPECGWFLRPIGKVGNERQFLPASVYWERQIDPETGEILGDDILRCEVGGVQCEPEEEWLWISKRPISEAEYMERIAALFRDHAEAS